MHSLALHGERLVLLQQMPRTSQLNAISAVTARTVSDLSASQRKFWDNFAPHYEQVHEPNTALVARILHEHMSLSKAHDVLEVGAGAGAGAIALASRLNAGARLVLTDLSPKMLELMR